jgi:Family of unknown function (DUF6459)
MRTVEVAPRGPRPPIRVRPAPASDPPFDDELAPSVWASVHQLALQWPGPAPVAPFAPPDEAAGHPIVAGASGDARLAVRRFVATCVEVLNGYRPAAHLRRLSLAADATAVVAQGLAAARRVAEARRGTRQSDRRGRRPGPVAVLRLRLCEPRPGAVEAVALVHTGDRTWAMALRLELRDGSWSATTLRLV